MKGMRLYAPALKPRLMCLFIVLALFAGEIAEAAKRVNFRTCETSPFCRRYRKYYEAPLEKLRPWRVRGAAVDATAPGVLNFTLEKSASTYWHPHATKDGTISSTEPSEAVHSERPTGEMEICAAVKIWLLQDGNARIKIDDCENGRFSLTEELVLPFLSDHYYSAGSEETEVSGITQLYEHGSILEGGDKFVYRWKIKSKPHGAHSQHQDRSNQGHGEVEMQESEVKIYLHPWKLEFRLGGGAPITLNGQARMNFEVADRSYPKITPSKAPDESVTGTQSAGEGAVQVWAPPADMFFDARDADGKDLYTYRFGNLADEMPQGPRGVGIDVHVADKLAYFGLGEHTDLKVAIDGVFRTADEDEDEPYRFWNSDVFGYELDTPMATYASFPYLLIASSSQGHHTSISQSGDGHGHGRKPYSFNGIMWLGGAETFVSLKEEGSGGNKNGHGLKPGSSWWASETGAIDVLLAHGATQEKMVHHLYEYSGYPPLQQANVFGFHQCRWNYVSTEDVETVQLGMDAANIPLDYVWLDIEHADQRQYFTWNTKLFKTPQSVTDELAANSRGLIAIVDPHVRKSKGYAVHDLMMSINGYVRDSDNASEFSGWCWPGNSGYPDFLRPDVRDLYAPLFRNWQGTRATKLLSGLSSPTLRRSIDNLSSKTARSKAPQKVDKMVTEWRSNIRNVQLWIDMNEPSVFNKPEVTLPRSTLHLQGTLEHRAVHNHYGLLFAKTAYKAMANRGDGVRPFILSRSGFLGSHRYGAIWTGDNTPTWGHYRVTIPMLLTLGLGGISLSGSDAGGFQGEPDLELFVRWTLLSAYTPFFRVHSNINTSRRELNLLPQPERDLVRKALQYRQQLNPFWYTLSHLNARTGALYLQTISDFNLRHHRSNLHEPSSSDIHKEYEMDRSDAFIIGDTFFVAPVLHTVANPSFPERRFPHASSVSWFPIECAFSPEECRPHLPSSLLPSSPTHTDWQREGSQKDKLKDVCKMHGSHRDEGSAFKCYDPNAIKFSPLEPSYVYQRTGTIVPTKMRLRRSVEAARFDPYTLWITLDDHGSAWGRVAVDDGRSLDPAGYNPAAKHSLPHEGALIQFRIRQDSRARTAEELHGTDSKRLVLETKVTQLNPDVPASAWIWKVSDEVERIIFLNAAVTSAEIGTKRPKAKSEAKSGAKSVSSSETVGTSSTQTLRVLGGRSVILPATALRLLKSESQTLSITISHIHK